MTIAEPTIKKARNIIVKRAAAYNPIYYADLYRELGLDHSKPGDRAAGSLILETIALREGAQCLITAFVVSKEGNGPCEGFYALAERLGRLPAGYPDKEKESFWIEEMKRSHDGLIRQNI